MTARFKGFSGPIGSGKSQALCQEAIRLSYVNQGRLGLLGAPTYPMLRDATQAALLEILQKNDIPYEHNKAENMLVFKDTGSRILFRPVDEFERLRGTNLAWFGLDELTYTQHEAWLRLEGRLRDPKATQLCGFAVWTPKGFDWVYRKFIADPVEGYGTVLAKPFENRHLLDKVKDFYGRLKDSYDEQFYQQEVLGSYLSMQGGRVYGAFDRTAHVMELEPNPHSPLYWALDFNVDPMSSVIVQIFRDEVRVLDEIVIRRATTGQACEEFLRRYPTHPGGVYIYGDASGNAQQTTGSTDYEMIREHFAVNSQHDGAIQGTEVQPVRAGPVQPDEPAIAIGGREHRAVSGSEVQGTDYGSGAGELQTGDLTSSIRIGTGRERTYRTRWAICSGRNADRSRPAGCKASDF